MQLVRWFFVYLVMVSLGTAGIVIYAVSHGYNSLAELSADAPSLGNVITIFICTAIISGVLMIANNIHAK